ncbi:MAG: glycosyltransferase family 2 protein [Desulfobaccales bacterium]
MGKAIKRSSLKQEAITTAENNAVLISIITICLNAANYIEKTIQSVLSQTYPHIEYIIIDGGSSDDTVEIIRKYASNLAYWHSQPDRGLAHAFNLGLAVARGDWLIYLHADDFFLESGVVEKMVPHLVAHPDMDVVFGQTIIMTNQEEPRPLPLVKIYGWPWRWEKFCKSDIIPHPSSFTNRRYFKRVGDFDESFKIAMDYEHFLRAGKNLQAHFVPMTVSGMRDEGTSRKSIIRTLREIRRAQEKNQALPWAWSWLNLWYQTARCFLGMIAHKVLDPFAGKMSWRGRSSRASLGNKS